MSRKEIEIETSAKGGVGVGGEDFNVYPAEMCVYGVQRLARADTIPRVMDEGMEGSVVGESGGDEVSSTH